MLETITKSERPIAASQAAKTSKIIGIIVIRVKCIVRASVDVKIKSDSIIPSRHRREDIMWDR